MELAPQQAKAYDLVNAWLSEVQASIAALEAKPFFYVAGYAGTGKTTSAKKITENAKNPLYGAYTGKAASVLKKKGLPAATLHSLIYTPIPPNEERLRQLYAKKKEAKNETEQKDFQNKIREELKPRFELNDESELRECDLLVVDEVSMVGEEMGRDLLSFKVPILVLGDPGQLPPITGEGFFTAGTPDFLLTDIHRQAAGNPIIAMATMARQGARLKAGQWGDSRVVWKNSFNEHQLSEADQVICGRNATRKASNARIRDSLGYLGSAPSVGEKLICLKNNKEVGILNGTQWKVVSCQDEGIWFDLELYPDGYEPTPEAGKNKPLRVSTHPFDADFNNMDWRERKRFEEFDYGYAITCHKSQGSQWNNIVVQNEAWCFREHQHKWLYTALTRAAEKVTVVL